MDNLVSPSSYLTDVGMSACFISYTDEHFLCFYIVLLPLCFSVKHLINPGCINRVFYSRYHAEYQGAEEDLEGQVCLTHL